MNSTTQTGQPQQQQQLQMQNYPQPQPHYMPTPPAAPWNLNAMPWKLASTGMEQDSVMQFRAQTGNIDDAMQRRALHQKRKSELPMIPLPLKQFISEEKITAHFNGLHISSDHIQTTNNVNDASFNSSGSLSEAPSTSGKCFTNLTYHDYQVTAKELEEKLRKANRITMCDEVKKLHEEQRKASFLPEALLNRIEKPCTALVLWQPPPILDLLQRKPDSEIEATIAKNISKLDDYMDEVDDDLYSDGEPDVEIDDFIDNNNTCRLDFNNLKADGMDEDL